MKYKIVLVPFPFDDLVSSKVRPAVCLTNPIGEHEHIILAFITSRVITFPSATDLIIDRHDPDFEQTGLRVSSMLRLHRLMTVTKILIVRELGLLPPDLCAQVDQKLHILFDLK